MTDTDLLSALMPVLRILDELGVRHHVGGSIASSAHGVARASVDADVVAELTANHVASFIETLRDGYYVPEERVREAVERRTSFNIIHLETTFKVDVFVSKNRPFDRRAFERSQPAPVGSDGQTLPVSSPEDIVLAKLDWFRRGGEVSERQWTDVLGVLMANPDVDLPYLSLGAEELEVSDLLERALQDARIQGGPK